MDKLCVNCGEAVKKSALFSTNEPLPDKYVAAINMGLGMQLEGACVKCGNDLLNRATIAIAQRKSALLAELPSLLEHVPLASINSPSGWEYDVLGLVTAQSVTGTGVFSDITSAFTDLFGTQSGAYNTKIKAGEDLCRASVRAQAMQMGGDAVLGIDVDYAEVGGQRAMLMVCITGTAVKLRNDSVVGEGFRPTMTALRLKLGELRRLETADLA